MDKEWLHLLEVPHFPYVRLMTAPEKNQHLDRMHTPTPCCGTVYEKMREKEREREREGGRKRERERERLRKKERAIL